MKRALLMTFCFLPLFSQANPLTADDVLAKYNEMCGIECASAIGALVTEASQTCGVNYDKLMLESIEMSGLHFVAIAKAVAHPLSDTLEQFAYDNLNCQDLMSWSQSIQDYSLVLEANNGLQGSNVN